jgi:16S rRNA (guanine527-N7)-methyltransferase
VQANQFEQLLVSALTHDGVELSERQVHLLATHYELMEKWSKVHNLTSIDSLQDALSYHYMDCIRGLLFLKPTDRVFDLGSGAGFPGLVAAVLWPHIQMTLVDSSRKKCSFLRMAALSMQMQNIEVLQARVEDLSDIPFALSRATFSLSFLNVAAGAMAREGKLALWLSKPQEAETVTQLLAVGFSKEQTYSYESNAFGQREILLLSKRG